MCATPNHVRHYLWRGKSLTMAALFLVCPGLFLACQSYDHPSHAENHVLGSSSTPAITLQMKGRDDVVTQYRVTVKGLTDHTNPSKKSTTATAMDGVELSTTCRASPPSSLFRWSL